MRDWVRNEKLTMQKDNHDENMKRNKFYHFDCYHHDDDEIFEMAGGDVT